MRFKHRFGVLLCSVCTAGVALAGPRQAPPGLFKEVNDQIVADAILINGKQLFVDDHLIDKLDGVNRVLNQPVKHPDNPFIVADQPWEENLGFSSVLFDEEEGLFKMWYAAWQRKFTSQHLCYATSRDGIHWTKTMITPDDAKEQHNKVFGGSTEFNCAGIFKDPHDTDDARRYKMVFSDYPDGTAKTASTSVAYSPDGIHWQREPKNPLIPFSDAQCAPFWDPRRGRYVTYLRFGPPNTRWIAMTESEDFVHWSPKITVMRGTQMDEPMNTNLYQMEVFPYDNFNYYFGLITTYHWETISPIPAERELWSDKADVQLTFSRDGRTWYRVGKHGAIRHQEYSKDRDWMTFSREATFIPWGEHSKDWDWGGMYPLQAPVVYNDQIWIYYTGQTGRHWGTYHADPPRVSGIGLATLRLDGFVSLNAEVDGTVTTKTLLFVGDVLELNADSEGGSIRVEVLDQEGKVIEGFSKDDCEAITTDGLRHQVQWNGTTNCQLVQGRPIKLRFFLAKARLYSFTPRIEHQHYIQSYD